MIGYLEIRDFVIVDHLQLALSPGMTAVTGETGAGKSIVVDALGLLLGDRADQGIVRAGSKRAELNAEFDIGANPAARQWLEEQELDAGGECILRRTISREGGSRGYINGRVVTLQQLRELGELLVDIHGQHQHQSLMRRDAQRLLLDEYAGNGTLAAELTHIHRDWKKRKADLDTLREQAESREARLDFVRYQAQELEALSLRPGEWQELEEEHGRLSNMDKLLGTTQNAVTALEDDDHAVVGLLGTLAHELESVKQFDPALGNAAEMLGNAVIQVEESAAELRRFLNNVELDPERLTELDQRMSSLYEVARKHRITPEELPDMLAGFQEELNQLENADLHVDQLQRELDTLTAQYTKVAKRLSDGRAKAAKTLSQRVSAAMQELGMPGGRLEVALQPLEDKTLSANGLERVEFLVAANPGQSPKPLAKVASGGELSRISLAIQVITSQIGGIPTLIFDEVDVGIGGGIAEIVGEKLRTLGERRQVLCVTHLPQVAAQGHAHLVVSKTSDDTTTRTTVRALAEKERPDEIARMLGGVEITAKTRAHAREMLQRAQARPLADAAVS